MIRVYTKNEKCHVCNEHVYVRMDSKNPQNNMLWCACFPIKMSGLTSWFDSNRPPDIEDLQRVDGGVWYEWFSVED